MDAPTTLPDTAAATIAVVLKGYPRLSETFIAQELRGLERAGFRLAIYSMRRPTDPVSHPIHREMQAAVVYLPEYLHEEPIRVMRSLWRARHLNGFRAALQAFFVDLKRDFSRNRFRRFGQAAVLACELGGDTARFYAHFIHTPSAVTRYAAMMTGLPWSISAHAKDIWTSPDWELSNHIRSAETVATCTAVGHTRLSELAAETDRVHLIYHGLDLVRFPAPIEQAAGPLRDGRTPETTVRLLCVGRAVPKKGIDVLLSALAQLPADFHWHLTHNGGGSELGKLKTQAQASAIGDRISWQGALDQSAVLAAYRASDLFVLPCRIAEDGDRDGLPNVLVEAQSQRLACISTPISGVPELIMDRETGLLVPSDDPRSLMTAILEIGKDPALRSRLALAGETRVRAYFDHCRGLSTLAALFPNQLRTAIKQSPTPHADHPATSDRSKPRQTQRAGT